MESSWIKSFLTDRIQRVSRRELSWAPSFLFCSLITYQMWHPKAPEVYCFADYTKVFHPISNVTDCDELQQNTSLTSQVGRKHGNCYSPKTNVFTCIWVIEITLNTIPPVPCHKWGYSLNRDYKVFNLGLTVDHKLNWDLRKSCECSLIRT